MSPHGAPRPDGLAVDGVEVEEAAVLFTDLVGSTEVYSSEGDDVAFDMFRRHAAEVTAATRSHGGSVVKSTGDGLLVRLPTAAAAVACALDIRDRMDAASAHDPEHALVVRMGVNVGAVRDDGDDLYGLAVSAAARIAAKASGGQVLVSDAICESAPGAAVYVDRGLFWLKGLPHQWRLHEAARNERDVAAPAAIEGRMPFVDREQERAVLRTLVDDVGTATGGLATIVGPQGSGKSRLAEELLLEAGGRGLRTFSVSCYEHGGHEVFRPVAMLLEHVQRTLGTEAFRTLLGDDAAGIARLLPDLRRRHGDIPRGPDLSADEARRYLLHCVTDVLGRLAATRPVVIVIDDLHRADDATVDLVEHLADVVDSLPVLVITTYTPDELSAALPLHRALAGLHRRQRVVSVELGPLDRDAVAQMLVGIGHHEPPPDLVAHLHALTRGEVFYLEELLRHLVANGRLLDPDGRWASVEQLGEVVVPESLRLTIEQRVTQLSKSTRTLLTVAAVIGRSFTLELIAALSELGEDELLDVVDEAEHAGLLTSAELDDTVRFDFVNQLVAQVLVEQVSLSRRQRLHLQVADALEAVHADAVDDWSVDIAHHLERAGRRAQPARTARFLRQAGQRSLEASAYATALAQLDRSLTLDPGVEETTRASVLESMAAAERSLGSYDDALKLWGEAIEIYEDLGAAIDVARVCLDAGSQVALWRRGQEVHALVERGLGALGDTEHPLGAGLLALAAVVASQAAQFERSTTLLDGAVGLAERSLNPRVLGLTLYSRAVHYFSSCQYTETVSSGRESIDLLRATGDVWELANVLGYVGASLGWLGKFDEAAAAGREGEALAAKIGNWPALVFSEQARTFADIGNDPSADDLERRGREIIELAGSTGFAWLRSIGHTRIGLASFWRGEWEEALAACERAASAEMRNAAGGHAGRLFLLHAYLGHRVDALTIIDEVRGEMARPGQPNSGTAWTLASAAVEALSMLGEHDAAAALYPTLLAHGETRCLMRSWDFRLVQTMCGVAAASGERWDLAVEHFTAARRQARQLPMRVEAVEVERFAATSLRRGPASLHADLPERLRRAAERYAALGMPRHATLAAGLLDEPS